MRPKKKKEGLHEGWNRFLCPNSLQDQSQCTQILIANANGGAIFAFSAKIGLKNAKNVVFCVLCKPMGGAIAPPPLTTLLLEG